MEQIINSCISTTGGSLELLAKYSHAIPMALSLVLGFFIFFKAKFNLFSKIFLAFILAFATWLLGDLVTWTSSNYNLIYTFWSFLVYIEVVFYLLGFYFVFVFIREKDVSPLMKAAMFLLTLPPLIVTIMGNSVLGFNQAYCEAVNNNSLDIYKLIIESLVLLTILFYIIRAFFLKNQSPTDRKADLIVLSSIFLFLSVFGVTEYIASTTGVYEINLYSMFVLPVFLLAIIYAVFELDIFKFNLLGTHYLVIGLVILIGGQLFFVAGGTDTFLTILTIVLSIILSFILFRNLRNESMQRVRIEKLSIELEDANEKLKSLDKLKTEFLSLASHQLRSPLTAIKGYTSMLMDGDFGNMTVKQKDAVGRVFESSSHLARTVEDLLNVSKIEQGGMQYVMQPFDFEKAAGDLAKDLSITAEKKGLKLAFSTDKKAPYTVNGDMEKIRQVILNLIDNSIKYTKKGSVKVILTKDEAAKKVRLEIKDTGMGVTPEIKATLFQKFARGEGMKVNTTGSGLGLYLGRQIIEGHKGKIGVDSEGTGKGSTFFIELDAV